MSKTTFLNSKNNIHIKILEYDAIQILKKLPFEINSMIEDYAIDYEIEKGRKIHKKKQRWINADIREFLLYRIGDCVVVETGVVFNFERYLEHESNPTDYNYLIENNIIRESNFWKIHKYLRDDFDKNEGNVWYEKNYDEWSENYREHLQTNEELENFNDGLDNLDY